MSGLLTNPVGNNSSVLAACFHNDDAFKYRAYTFTYLLLFPVAFLCNIGALVVFFLQSSRRNSASCVVMMNLAISDGSFSLTLPLRLAYYFKGGVWPFPDWLCRLCVYGFYVNLYTRAGFPRCFEPSSPSSWGRVLILNYVAVVLGFLLPFLTIIFCYSRIIRRLMAPFSTQGSSQSNNTRHRNRRRSVHLVTMVTVTFLFCFLPYHVIRSLHLHAVCEHWNCAVTVALQRVVVVTLCLAASNSVVNPLLYYYSTRTFRDNMRDAQSSLLSSRGTSMRQGLSLMRRRNTT
ncbi:cysteinyl leukotriene receptor 1 isoform X2 [Epinephelus lanceolatus]|uniref:cysteinyl leukotriene receptor 1-like isoform X2 n=1 Tax=Epinephelus lanceolatus TaxID=310571 RepID=UPI0014456F5A|nr:cysteinyl leukotriene receptor 1-like isoform X2 [Epinephelus lanceolatus]